MNIKLIKLPTLSLLLALSAPVFAADTTTIKVEEPWARESPPTVTNGAAYMTLVNTGKEADRLVGASGEVSATVELHTHLMEDGVMKMRPIKAIEVNPGEPAVLRPGGLHIMLIGLKKPLVAGQTFPLRLRFEKAGEMPVEVKVRKMELGGGSEHSGHQVHKAQ
ncbi:MAG: copper chaperone PCu(A)C [Candidatus Contendobacter sp.]|nr:copper chaperone PCu(A)C [Candidatus Contendobacter sp.]